MSAIALIAGAGALPAAVAAALPEAPLVCALDGIAPDGLAVDLVFRFERLVPFLRSLGDRGVETVVLAGAVHRPRLDPALFDRDTAALVPDLLAAMQGGDDGALRWVIGLIEEKLAGGGSGFIFDGFTQTLAQADALGDLLARMGQSLDAVIEMRVDDAALVARITARSTCGNCGEVYNDVTKPIPADGKCTVCGGTEFKRRSDDNEESLKQRLMEYYKKTSPLIGYYYHAGKLTAVDGLGEIGDVAKSIAVVLDR